MSDTPRVERVRAEDVQRGAMVEKTEHPWASAATARKIAKDHLKENPKYYGTTQNRSHPQSSGTVVILNQNVKAIPPRKHKKQPPKQKEFNVLTWGNELLG